MCYPIFQKKSELLVLREAVLFAILQGRLRCIFEGDREQLIQQINRMGVKFSTFGAIVANVKGVLEFFSIYNISLIGLESNVILKFIFLFNG